MATATAQRSASSGASRAARRRKQLRGCETPRIWTPPLRELTPETSLGFAAIEFAETICGIALFPWQKWLLIHAMELDVALTVSTLDRRGPLDPIFRFRKVVVLVARQNGKSTLSQVLSLFFLYELGTDLILGTAQDLDTAEEVWEGALDIIEETPELADRALRPIMVNGKKTIRLDTGERYKVKAANRKAGRGLSGDLILLDELREHQTWDAWAAITKTTNARPAALIASLSNAGDATSVVLRHLRKQAHAALGDPDGINAQDDPSSLLPTHDEIDEIVELAESDLPDLDLDDFEEDESTLGLFEWSAKPGVPVTDIDGLLQANPSVGYCVSLRTLLSDAKDDPEWVTRTEVLCQWSDGTLEGPFPPGTWDACGDEESKRGDGVAVKLCVEVSWDRSKTHIGLATYRADGVPHVELIASRAGTDWPIAWFTDAARSEVVKTAPIVIQKGSPAGTLIDPLREEGLDVTEWSGEDVPTGTGALYDAVRQAEDGEPGLHHLNQPALNLAASVAVPKMTSKGAFMWDSAKSPADIGPLKAVTGAFWLLTKPAEQPTRSVYEDRGVLTI